MSIFKSLFGSKSEPSPRDIVYEFAGVLGQLNNPILDTVLLRRSKEDIYAAFHAYIPQLEAMARVSRDSASELQQVKTTYLYIADFQDIDPEDRTIVSEINAGRRFAKLRSSITPAAIKQAIEEDPDTFAIWNAITTKYMQRSFREKGIE